MDADTLVVGAGLGGCMAALLLSKRGKVLLIEARSDLRESLRMCTPEWERPLGFEGRLTDSAKRSINLALSYRGIQALKACDLWDEVKSSMLTEMKGRLIHTAPPECEQHVQPYTHPSDCDEMKLWSISRVELNALLLDKLEELNVRILFNHKCLEVSPEGTTTVEENETGEKRVLKSKLIVGADGINSAVRTSMFKQGRFNFSQEYIPHDYKELTIMPGPAGQPQMPANYLHIWPRNEFMLIGLPNPDNTFTCTMFAPSEGSNSFTALEPKDAANPTEEETQKIVDHFRKYFPDVPALIPNYIEQFLTNPRSPLKQVNVKPWHLGNRVCILGDAAHAVVPFFGQGMNCAFEDALILYEMLEKHNDIEKVIPLFSKTRQCAVEALITLSNRNYLEMRSHTAQSWFQWKKQIEDFLFHHFPSVWRPIYPMVSFSRTPYDEALERADKQDNVLLGAGLTAGGVALLALARLLSKM